MTLIALASRQIWPQVLAVLHAKPKRVVLLHTAFSDESKGPAERLNAFFSSKAIETHLRLIPQESFQEIVDAFASVAEEFELDETNCRVHFSGGNKIMALAATEWCRLAGVECFYLERNHRLYKFLPVNQNLTPLPPEKVDPHLSDSEDPLPMLRCQVGSSNISCPGQKLTLNEKGTMCSETDIKNLLKNGTFDFRKHLNWDVEETEHQPGFALEYATAVVILKQGVPCVQRSIKLSPKSNLGSGNDEGELDLVFNWGGKLWIVDCKDRNDADVRIDKVIQEIHSQTFVTKNMSDLLQKLKDELESKELKFLKEDLLTVAETAGLLGKTICVRRAHLPAQAQQFAQSRKIEVIQKDRLFEGFKRELKSI